MGVAASSRSTVSSSSHRLDGAHIRGEKSNRIWFLLHRTWTIVVTEKWTPTRTHHVVNSRRANCSSDSESQYSRRSGDSRSQSRFTNRTSTCCTCVRCQRQESLNSSGPESEGVEEDSMAPNSDESLRIQQIAFPDDTLKEKQRPPLYNPEDYAISLKKWGKKSTNGSSVTLYPVPTDLDVSECSARVQRNSFRDYRNPMLISSGSEMTLRQFGTVTELLAKLNLDLRLAYPSFVQEFVADPLDGVTLLLDLLRGIQMSQSSTSHYHQQPGSSNTTGRISPAIQRRALLDELSCLQCLMYCCQRYSESLRRFASSSAGLFTLSICIMSSVTKSRILALELLTKVCGQSSNTNGHSSVSEALSTLRLRFGEPVRFRFLVGMLMSARGQGELLVAGMKFLNAFLSTAGSLQKQLYIQAELEQAGFDVALIKENISISSTSADQLFEQLDSWEKKYLDVENLSTRLQGVEKENDVLRDKILLLERRVQILLEEKGILISLEQCLKDRCSELQEEMFSMKSEQPRRNSSCNSSKRLESPHEDEGISSSEQSTCPEETPIVQSSLKDSKIMDKSSKIMKNNNNTVNICDNNEEETTIEEVIQELKTIVHNAENEVYLNEQRQENMKRNQKNFKNSAFHGSKMSKKHKHTMSSRGSSSYILDSELEIVPSNLHPQPPRRSKSLIHLFIPAEDYDYGNKELFFENETNFSSQDSSADSLLSTSKFNLLRIERNHPLVSSMNYSNNQQDIAQVFDLRTDEPTKTQPYRNHAQDNTISTEFDIQQKKSKSLDRIDDGLDTMVNIIVTDHKLDKEVVIQRQICTKSDSGNITGGSTTCLSRSMSNIFTPIHDHRREISNHKNLSREQTMKICLPLKYTYGGNLPYHFPRIQQQQQERKHNSFLIKRGHSNAGLYSGQITTTGSGNEVICGNNKGDAGSNKFLVGKVTDMPSGLY